MRFIVAIPNYNHGESLVGLLDQLLLEDFDKIYVLDDTSTDNSLELLKSYLGKIKLIKGPYNLGPAGNRNRIIPSLEKDDLVMFIDADMQLETKNIRQIMTKLFDKNLDVAMFGGGITDTDDKPMTYNYGKHQSQFRHGVGLFLERLTLLLRFRLFISIIRPIARRFTYNIEIRYYEPKGQVVESVSEAHFYVRGNKFKELNGFNENLRYHEGGEFAYRLRKSGSHIKFTPKVWAKHLAIHPRKKLRDKEGRKLKKILENE